jgi:hypothetical protein
MGLLKIVAGTVVEQPQQGLSFQCIDGDLSVICGITESAFEEIIQFYRLDVRRDESFDFMVGEIEKILNQKRDAGRLEPNGSIVARTIDVLRYGTTPDADSKVWCENVSFVRFKNESELLMRCEAICGGVVRISGFLIGLGKTLYQHSGWFEYYDAARSDLNGFARLGIPSRSGTSLSNQERSKRCELDGFIALQAVDYFCQKKLN